MTSKKVLKTVFAKTNQPQEVVIQIFYIKAHMYLDKINTSKHRGTILLINQEIDRKADQQKTLEKDSRKFKLILK